MNVMKDYEVVEVVRETLIRKRTWTVNAISEQDAIRRILEGEAAEDYVGKQIQLESSTSPVWIVDGIQVDYSAKEAVAMDDGFTDIGGGD